MTGGDWTQEAMSDDSLVAEALICLHHAEPPPPPVKNGGSDLKLKWNVRQRRSKAATPSRKKGDHTRSSPTTPLSWSGTATSLSGGGGGGGGSGAPAVNGVEESSGGVKLSEAVRSKVRFGYFDIPLLFFSLVFETLALLYLGCVTGKRRWTATLATV